MLPERVTSYPALLRLFTPADAACVEELAADAEVAETTASIPHPYPHGAAQAWIASHDSDRGRGAQYTYAIVSADRTLIGAIGLRPLADEHDNIGYWIGRPYWGRGYATAATIAVTALAFGYLDCETLAASHLERNPASGRVLEKCGFALLRMVMREHRGKAETFCVWGMARDAWELQIGGSPGVGMPAEGTTTDRS